MNCIIIISIAVIILCVLVWQNMLMLFKISYYEQKFKNHRGKFTSQQWKHLKDMFNRKNPFT